MAGIYIHIPFCSQSCNYCDFHFSTSLKIKERMIICINREIKLKKKYLKNPLIHTIYFGGGTPSLISGMLIKEILCTIKSNFRLINNTEITIEANPDDISEEKIQQWHKIGINRVSLGIQSFRDQDLIYMNRSHNAQQSILALDLLSKSTIQNISVDLIYGFPLLSDLGWLENLEKVINYNINHISCYCLTVEKKTALYHFIKTGKEKPIEPKKGISQFLAARKFLRSAGYHHYEISNFCIPNQESEHNKSYWNRSHYIGVGPSAHSFNGISRQWNIKNNIKYCNNIEKNTPYYYVEKLSKKDIINEYILTSIRTANGLDLDFFIKNMSKNELLTFNKQILSFTKSKLITSLDNRIFLTEKGMLIADSISADLFLI